MRCCRPMIGVGEPGVAGTDLPQQPAAELGVRRQQRPGRGGPLVVVARALLGAPPGGQVGGQGRVEAVHAAAEPGQQPGPGRGVQDLTPGLPAGPLEPLRDTIHSGEGAQDVSVGGVVEQADGGQQPLVGRLQVGVGVAEAGGQGGEAAALAVVPAGQRRGPVQARQQHLRGRWCPGAAGPGACSADARPATASARRTPGQRGGVPPPGRPPAGPRRTRSPPPASGRPPGSGAASPARQRRPGRSRRRHRARARLSGW